MNWRAMTSRIGLIAIALLLMGQAALKTERFECTDPIGQFDTEAPVIVVAKASRDGKTGVLEIGSIVHVADYAVEGFNRIWRFGKDDLGYRYAFIIGPNGDAVYADFLEKPVKDADPIMQKFFCKKTL